MWDRKEYLAKKEIKKEDAAIRVKEEGIRRKITVRYLSLSVCVCVCVCVCMTSVYVCVCLTLYGCTTMCVCMCLLTMSCSAWCQDPLPSSHSLAASFPVEYAHALSLFHLTRARRTHSHSSLISFAYEYEHRSKKRSDKRVLTMRREIGSSQRSSDAFTAPQRRCATKSVAHGAKPPTSSARPRFVASSRSAGRASKRYDENYYMHHTVH